MPGFRRRHSSLYRLQIPHFAKQDHIRRLPQAGPQGGNVAGGVHGQLPLADNALVVPVEVFNGVLNGNDMGVPGAIHRVHDAGQSRGFAAAGRAGNQDHAPGHVGDLHDLLGDVHFPPIGDAEADYPNHRRQGTPLPVGVDPEPGQAGDREREIVIPHGDTPIDGSVGHIVQLPDQRLRIIRHQAVTLDGHELAVPLNGHRPARYDEQVGGIFLHSPLQICLDTFHALRSLFLFVSWNLLSFPQ